MLTTIAELQQRFNDDVTSKFRDGLRKDQAEGTVLYQIVRDAHEGLIDPKVARDFIAAIEVAKGATPGAAKLTAKTLFAGGRASLHETPARTIPQAGTKPGD